MSIIHGRNLDIEVAGSTLLADIAFRIEQGDKVGLIGLNGAGKTTLIRAVLGEIAHENGEIYRNGTIGYLPQTPDLEILSGNVFEAMIAERSDILDMRRDLRFLEIRMSEQADEKTLEQYSMLTARYEAAGGYSLEAQVRRILTGLGLAQEQTQEIPHLSGGQKTRLSLGRLLLREPDLLILDEPTNHLDIEALEWLENYLAEYRGAVLIVSHDRYFLDHIVTRILYIRDGALKAYNGNYSEFELQRSVEELTLEREAERMSRKIAALEEYIRRHGAGIKAKQARGRESQLNRLQPIEVNKHAKSLNLNLQARVRTGDRVLDLTEVAVAYNGRTIFEQASLEMRRGDKIALLGKNGVGKTSLLKAIIGKIPYRGTIRHGANVKLAYYSQEHEDIGLRDTVIDEIRYASKLEDPEIRNLLARFGFRGDDVFKAVNVLSGGEKSRLALCKLFLSDGNFLLLDEPTNHLDMDTREVLEDALKNYDGTILTVSHDRYFLDKVVNKVALLTATGLRLIDGDYTTYKEVMELELPKEAATRNRQDDKDSQDARSYHEESRNNRRKEKKIKQLEQKIEETEALIGEIEQQLELAADDYEKALLYSERLEHVKNEHDELMAEWLEIIE